jgi:toxin ParE1/3/4
MDYQVIWLDDAIEDLGKAVKYIARHNPAAARRTGDAILKKAELLAQFPRFGKIFAKLRRDDVREVPVPPYRLIYHIRDANRTINILIVWHGARREPDALAGL